MESSLIRRCTHFSDYQLCQKCSRVVLRQIRDSDEPCPSCSSAGFSFQMWPQLPARAFFCCDAATNLEEPGVAAILVAAGCEQLMRDLLWDVLGARNTPHDEAIELMRNRYGRDALVEVYKRQTPHAVGQVLTDGDMKRWWDTWSRVTKTRNAASHGHWYRFERAAPDDVRLLRAGAIPAFVALHNAAVDSSPP